MVFQVMVGTEPGVLREASVFLLFYAACCRAPFETGRAGTSTQEPLSQGLGAPGQAKPHLQPHMA